MEIKYITTAEVIETNRVLLEKLEHERFSTRDNYIVEEVVDSLTRYCNAKEDFKEKILCKASFLLFELCTKHAFLDANKRTAMVCCFIFLTRNNIFPGFGSKFQKELAFYVKGIAQNQHSKSSILKWLNAHTFYLSEKDIPKYGQLLEQTKKELNRLINKYNSCLNGLEKVKKEYQYVTPKRKLSLSKRIKKYKIQLNELSNQDIILGIKVNALQEYSLLIKNEK